jgi:hypothetical protein
VAIPDAYPEGYRFGFEMYIWFAAIGIGLVFCMIFAVRAKKSSLVNRKQLYWSNFIFYISAAAMLSLLHISYLIPDQYTILQSFAITLTQTSVVFWFYYWEKNLTHLRVKFLPVILVTIIDVISIAVFLINFIAGIVIIENSNVFMLIGTIFVALFMYGLSFQFFRRVSGKFKKLGIFLFLGIAFFQLSLFLDYPPIFAIFPEFPPIIAPTLMLLGATFYGYSLLGIIDGITAFYQQKHICTVHRGEIKKDRRIYLCPTCATPYCDECYDAVIKNEGCWNCGHGGASDKTDGEWKSESVEAIAETDNIQIDEKKPKGKGDPGPGK